MGRYEVSFVRSARKDLDRLPAKLVERIFPKIARLAEQPRPPGCEKLQGEEALWRIRIGDYRIVFYLDDRRKIVEIRRVRHRREVYR